MATTEQTTNDRKAAEDPRILIGGRFRVDPLFRLPDFDSPGAEAFAASDESVRSRRLYALVCASQFAPRISLINTLVRYDGSTLIKPIAFDVTFWPPLGRRLPIIVLEQPSGPRVQVELDSTFEPVRDEALARVFLLSLLPALKDFEGSVISHRALRADNLYYTDATKTAVLLGECVSSPPALYQPMVYETIESCIAHPLGRGAGSVSEDLYSLGVLMVILASGGNPMAGMSDEEILSRKISEGSYGALMGMAKPSMTLIEPLRGLLHDDPNDRWNVESLSEWLGGKRQSPKQNLRPSKGSKAFLFRGKEYWSDRTLALALSENWDDAVAEVSGEDIADWLRRSLGDDERAENVNLAMQATALQQVPNGRDAILSTILMILDPSAPLRFRNYRATLEALAGPLVLLPEDQTIGRDFADIVLSRTANTYLELQMVLRSDAFLAKQSINQMYTYLKKDLTGFGLERCLYEFNPDQACRSPLIAQESVLTIEGMLPALEKRAVEGIDEEPIDAHVAAFCGAKLQPRLDAPLERLGRASEGVGRLIGQLRLLAILQRRVGLRSLVGLARRFAALCHPKIAAFHSNEYRNALVAAVEDRVQSGNLGRLLELLDNAAALARDRAGFMNAQREYAALEQRIDWLRGGGLNRPENVQHASQQAACLIAGGLSGLALMVMSVMFVF